MKQGNILYMPTLQGQWCDKDIVMVHAAFTILEKFVDEEWEGGFTERVSWLHGVVESEPADRVWAEDALDKTLEIQSLYLWWQERKVADFNEISEAVYRKDNEMLHRLVNVRSVLWD